MSCTRLAKAVLVVLTSTTLTAEQFLPSERQVQLRARGGAMLEGLQGVRGVLSALLRPGPAEPPGLIGMKVLQNFVLTLDAKNRRVRFESN